MSRPLILLLFLGFLFPNPVHGQIWSRPWGDVEKRTHHAEAMAFSADGQWVFTAGVFTNAKTQKVSGEILAWNVANPEIKKSLRDPENVYGLHRGHTFAVSPDGKTLAAAGDQRIDGRPKKFLVDLWDWPTGKKRASLQVNGSFIFFYMVFSGDGKNLVTSDRRGTVISWDVTSAKERWRRPPIERPGGVFNPVAFAWKDQLVVFGTSDKEGSLDFFGTKTGFEVGSYWNLNTGKELGDFFTD